MALNDTTFGSEDEIGESSQTLPLSQHLDLKMKSTCGFPVPNGPLASFGGPRIGHMQRTQTLYYDPSIMGNNDSSMNSQQLPSLSNENSDDNISNKQLNKHNSVFDIGLSGVTSAAHGGHRMSYRFIPKQGHITPDWYHLRLCRMTQKKGALNSHSIMDRNESNAALSGNEEVSKSCEMIEKALKLRDKWVYNNQLLNSSYDSYKNCKIIWKDYCRMMLLRNDESLDNWANDKYKLKWNDGVMNIIPMTNEENDEKENENENDKENEETPRISSESSENNNGNNDNNDEMKDEFDCESCIFEGSVGNWKEYTKDLNYIIELTNSGPAKTLAYHRLKILQSRFELFLWINNNIEQKEISSVPYRDFYNVRKVDGHIHHSACMHQTHLLKYIRDTYRDQGYRVVEQRLNKTTNKMEGVTLKELFDEMGVDVRELNLDLLAVHAGGATFERFDKFNLKYNPMGKGILRQLFLKHDNDINGEFLADITKKVIKKLEHSTYQFAEWRLSVYGKKMDEWNVLAKWILNYRLVSFHVKYLIQIPRIYFVFKSKNIVKTFDEMLQNIFEPLFQVTLNPAYDPDLAMFLQFVVGFDSVDDESRLEIKHKHYPSPSQWDNDDNPPYTMWMYYMWANITKLNKLRAMRGLNQFAFRPHSGEAGDLDHLASSFLLSNGINHGIRLYSSVVLQYLYYLKQIGISMSPLSNNILFVKYDENPFIKFFQRGLNVALSTDDPLLIHFSKNALMEEYSIASQVYKLSNVDLCEIARNSVLQCGWSFNTKSEWLGNKLFDKWQEYGSESNDIYHTNVPDIRIEFRKELLDDELHFVLSNGDPKVGEIRRNYSKNSLNSLNSVESMHHVLSPIAQLTQMHPHSHSHSHHGSFTMNKSRSVSMVSINHTHDNNHNNNNNNNNNNFNVNNFIMSPGIASMTHTPMGSGLPLASVTAPTSANNTNTSMNRIETIKEVNNASLEASEIAAEAAIAAAKTVFVESKLTLSPQKLNAMNALEMELQNEMEKKLHSIYEPRITTDISVINKNVVTPFGIGIINQVSKDNQRYYVEFENTLAYISKNDCIILANQQIIERVFIPIENRYILVYHTGNTHNNSIDKDTTTSTTIESDNADTAVNTNTNTNKNENQTENKNSTSDSIDNEYNDIATSSNELSIIEIRNQHILRLHKCVKEDLRKVIELELESYPSDEAATPERLYYRFIFANDYFWVLKNYLNKNEIVGFVVGTLVLNSKLTEESMSNHDENGKHLCIHSVVINKEYRKNGFGLILMKKYLYNIRLINVRQNKNLQTIRLVSKKHLIAFYEKSGFKLIGESDLDHGKDTWYDMVLEL